MSTETKIANLLKNNCSDFISQIRKGQCLYTDSKSNSLFLKENANNNILSENTVNAVAKTLDVLQTPIYIDNYVIASPMEKMHSISYVMFPINECKAVWFRDLQNITDLDDVNNPIYVPISESELSDEIRQRVTSQIRDDLKVKTSANVRDRWQRYLRDKAEEYVYKLPSDHPSKFDEDKVDNLVNKWMTHYKDEMESESNDLTDKLLLDYDSVSKIETLVAKNIEKNIKTKDEYELSEDLFMLNYNDDVIVGNLTEAIDSKKDVMITCNEYYVIDTNYYKMFIEEKLWP